VQVAEQRSGATAGQQLGTVADVGVEHREDPFPVRPDQPVMTCGEFGRYLGQCFGRPLEQLRRGIGPPPITEHPAQTGPVPGSRKPPRTKNLTHSRLWWRSADRREPADARDVNLAGGRLESPDEARTVRVRDGEMLITDGPFAETKEQVAGLNILTCPTLAEAAEIASHHPTALIGALELRPFAKE
jgi:hypothetical protein